MAGLLKTRKHRQKHKYLSVEYKNGKWHYSYKTAKPTSRKKNVTGSAKVNKSNMNVAEIQAVNLVKDELDSALHGTWGKKKKKSKKKLSLTNRNRANKNGRVPKMSHNNHQNNELMHRQKGAQNKNHKYLNRIVKNGKYVYDYGTRKAGQAAAAVKTAAGQVANTVSTAATGAANTAVRKYNNYNSAAAKQSRERSRRLVQVRTQKKIAKGRAKVNSIIQQLKQNTKKAVGNARFKVAQTDAYKSYRHAKTASTIKKTQKQREKNRQNQIKAINNAGKKQTKYVSNQLKAEEKRRKNAQKAANAKGKKQTSYTKKKNRRAAVKQFMNNI